MDGGIKVRDANVCRGFRGKVGCKLDWKSLNGIIKESLESHQSSMKAPPKVHSQT
jgi:hypothetical protein